MMNMIAGEEALMAGETCLVAQARKHEETAEGIAEYDWEAARNHYHITGRNRLMTRRLRAMYDKKFRRKLMRP